MVKLFFLIEKEKMKMTEKENPWFEKAKELEKQLEAERTRSARFLMKVERIIVQKMQEIIDEIDDLYSELGEKENE